MVSGHCEEALAKLRGISELTCYLLRVFDKVRKNNGGISVDESSIKSQKERAVCAIKRVPDAPYNVCRKLAHFVLNRSKYTYLAKF
jgi:hypothetical protein